MKKKSASQLVRRSLSTRRSPASAGRRLAGEGGFFNLRMLAGLFTVLAGVFLALLSFGVFSAKAQQKEYVVSKRVDPLVPAGFDCSRIHELRIDKQENLRAGATMIACGEAQGGTPSLFRTFSQLTQELMAPLTYGTTDLDLITGTETYPEITQSETFTAGNPDNPNQIVVAYNDLRGRNSSPINISGASVSTDGGTTFTRLTKANGQSPFDNALGDPVILYNRPTQTWFTAWIDQSCGSQGIGGYKSTTPWDPNSWTHYCVHNGSSDDRESGYADNNPSSPHYGNMYISYNDFVVGEGALSVRVSTDNGLTWTDERQLTGGTRFVRNVQITGDLATGDVYIAGMDEGGGGFPHNNTNLMFRSTDGGDTWTNTYTGPAFPSPGVTAVGYWPCMFSDGGGYWRHQGWGQPAAFNHIVHLVYAQHGAGSDPGDVYYIRSTDSGVTFGAPFKLNSDPFTRPQWQPNISVSPTGTLFAVWYDARESASCTLGDPAVPCYRMFSRKSTDNGVSWLPDLQFSDVVTPLPEEPSSGVESTYAGDYDYGSALLTRHFTAWTDGRVMINAASQQDAFFDSEPVSPTPNPTVTPSPLPGPITLSASGRKVGGINTVDLTWSPFGPPINAYRNRVQIATVANIGTYTDSTGSRGSATYTYLVCEAGTSTCSNTAVVIFGSGSSPTPSPTATPTPTATATATVTPTATIPPTPTATATLTPTPTATATATATGTATPTPTASPTPTCTWLYEPPMNNARGVLATAVVGPYLYAIGGYDNVNTFSSANERFDGVTWTNMAPIPKPNFYAKAAAVGSNIYVPGGNAALGITDSMQIYNTVTDTWSYGANLPAPRAGGATVAFNGRVYIIAGANSFGDPTSSVYIYDPVSNSYTTGAPMPGIQWQNIVGGVLFNGEIYVVGGWHTPGAHHVYNPTTNTWRTIAPLPTNNGVCHGSGFVLNDAVWMVGCYDASWIYDPDSDTWRQGPSSNVPHLGSSAELFNGRGFVVGGGTGLEGSAAVESIDCPNPSPTPTPTATVTPTCTWLNEPAMNTARGILATAVVGPYLYAIGGDDGDGHMGSPANERFDGVTWTNMAPVPRPVQWARAVAVGNNIYVPGGVWIGGYTDVMQIYNTQTDTWSYGAHLPAPRAGMATVAFNGLVYMIAGSDNAGHNEVFIYDPVTDSYTIGAPMPDVQGFVAGVLFNGEIYVVGGWDAPGAHYVYNPTTNTWRTIAPLPTNDGKCLGAGKGFVLNNAVWIVGCGAWIYDPDSDTWRQGPPNNVPRVGSSAELFNGRGFVVGGGNYLFGSAAVESIDCPNPSPTPTPTATATPTATPTPVTLMLMASGRKVNKINTVDLSWSPSGSSPNVDVKRNGVLITTTPNDGAYTDSTGDRGSATYTYQVCEAGTSNCSNIVSVSFGGGH